MIRARRVALGALVAVLGAGAGDAAASSIVYLKGGDVHLSPPDGSRAVRLTTGGGYESPSQADSGTVVAVKPGDESGVTVRRIVRMDRTGKPIGTPVATGPTNASTYSGPLAAEVAPDGSLLAFDYRSATYPHSAFAPLDRDSNEYDYGDQSGDLNPSWFDDSHVVVFAAATFPNVLVDSPGNAANTEGREQGWFNDPYGYRLSSGAVDRQLDQFAAITADGSRLLIYRMNGPPPAVPTPKCEYGPPHTYAHASWSPDGRQLAWEQPDGIHVADVPTLDPCAAITEKLVIPGGADPDWGPADVAKEPCVVPKLKGRTVSKAKRLLTAAGCKLGTVTRRASSKANSGRVMKQSPKSGATKKRWTRVSVTVGS